MTREDDPLKQTPACELDRDNRAMTRREPDIAARNETADLQMFNSALERALVAECDSQRAEIERLMNAIRRINGINDNPACYNPAINAVCDAILRPHLEPKP